MAAFYLYLPAKFIYNFAGHSTGRGGTCPARGRRRLNLSIQIVNEYKGSQPPIMTDIDELGASLHKELSQFTSKDKLTKEAYRTPIPMA